MKTALGQFPRFHEAYVLRALPGEPPRIDRFADGSNFDQFILTLMGQQAEGVMGIVAIGLALVKGGLRVGLSPPYHQRSAEGPGKRSPCILFEQRE